jgi:hypothetical protein
VDLGSSVNFQLSASDPNNDPLHYDITQAPAHGIVVLQVQTGAASYTPNPDYCGPDSFKFKVSDSQCDSAEATVSITVNCPTYVIGWANLQWPPTMTHTVSAVNRTDNAYGQVWIDGVTNQPGATPGLRAQLGYGPVGSNPDGHANWVWVDASFNVDAGNNDEFIGSVCRMQSASDYVYRPAQRMVCPGYTLI